MVKFLKLLDSYNRDFFLTYKGKERFKTNLGGVVSILSYISIAVFAFFIGIDINKKEKPKVIVISKEEQFTPAYRFKQNLNLLELGFSDDTSDINIDSFVEIFPVFIVKTKNNNDDDIFKEYLLEMENCGLPKANTTYYPKCVKDMDLYLSGSWLESSITYLAIFLRKCSDKPYKLKSNIKTEEEKTILDNFVKNLNVDKHSNYLGKNEFNKELNLLDKLNDIERNYKTRKTICMPKEKIIEKLDEPIYVDITYNGVESNPTQHINSLFPSKKQTFFSLSNNLQKYANFYYSNYLAEIDYGLIFEDFKKDVNIIGIDHVDRDFKLTNRNFEILAEIDFYMTAKTKIYQKTYIKIHEIFSQSGGFISSTFLIFSILLYPFLMKKKNIKILNSFYELNDDKKLNEKMYIKLQEIKSFHSSSRKEINEKMRKDNLSKMHKKETIIFEEKNQEDSELIDILKNKKKKFTDSEIFRSSYFLTCNNENIKKKNSDYKIAMENIYKGSDFLEIIKLNKEFKILKFLLFNNVQQRTFDFLTNLKIGEDRFYDVKEYPEIITAKDTLESLKIIKKYYQKDKKKKKSRTDSKLKTLFHPNIMRILNDVDFN